MDDPRHERLYDLFAAALRVPQAEREAWLTRQELAGCDLVAELRRLLAEEERGTTGMLGGDRVTTGGRGRPISARIGRYRIEGEIGEGGMGTVYRATEPPPSERTVALKILKAGLDTARMLRRFELERTALARMRHPSIARLLDVGSIEGGRPYFVMELADGEPIDRFCDREAVTLSERLELFARVCDGVHHAHQNGVIHRDIKPANVMVRRGGDGLEPKIIDFGIARQIATDDWDDDPSLTEHGEVIGTLWFMSPEQAEPRRDGIDTRADVYALGVLLYRLVTGRLPLPPERFEDRSVTAVRRVLREEEPPRPSEVATVAVGDPPVDAELDAIIMTAIAKERDRRYPSASELATDVRRYLADEPVSVRTPRRRAAWARFVRRHRAAVTAVAGVLLVLAAGCLFGFLGMRSAALERDAARAARDAEAELRRQSERVTGFLTDALSLLDPQVALGGDPTVRTLLRQVSGRIDGSFPGMSRAEAAVRRTVGTALHNLGEVEAAEAQLLRSLRLLEDDPEVPPDELYATLRCIWLVSLDADSQEVAAIARRASLVAERCLRDDDAVIARELHALLSVPALHDLDDVGPRLGVIETRLLDNRTLRDVDRLMVADVFLEMGRLLGQVYASSSAVRMLRASATIRRSVLPTGHPDVGRALYRLALTLAQSGQYDEARSRAEEAISCLTRSLPAEHWLLAASRSVLGDCLSALDDPDRGEVLMRAGHARVVEARGERCEATAWSNARLMRHYRRTGDPAAAERHRAELARSWTVSANAPIAWALKSMAVPPGEGRFADLLARVELRVTTGVSPDRSDDLTEMLDRAMALRRERFAANADLSMIFARQLVDWSLFITHVDAETRRRMNREALCILRAQSPPPVIPMAQALLNLAGAEVETGDVASALRHSGEAIEWYRRGDHGDRDHEVLICRVTRSMALLATGDATLAAQALADLLVDCRAVYGVDHEVTRAVERFYEQAVRSV